MEEPADCKKYSCFREFRDCTDHCFDFICPDNDCFEDGEDGEAGEVFNNLLN